MSIVNQIAALDWAYRRMQSGNNPMRPYWQRARMHVMEHGSWEGLENSGEMGKLLDMARKRAEGQL